MMSAGTSVATSYNGIAAFNIDGQTLCKTLSIDSSVGVHSKSDLSRDKLQELKMALSPGTMCLFIVDEISTLDTPTVAMIDKRLKQLRQSELRFGGIAMMFVGDFNQLGPVQKVFIPKDTIEWAAHQINRDARNKKN